MQVICFLNICIQGDKNSFINHIIHLLSLWGEGGGGEREERKEKEGDLGIYFLFFRLVLVVTLQHNCTILRHFTIRLLWNVTSTCVSAMYI